MPGEGGRVKGMILAKPLKRKDLGHSEPSKSSTESKPEHIQIASNNESLVNQTTLSKESYRPKDLRGKTMSLIQLIVNQSSGLNAYQVYYLFREFCKRYDYYSGSTKFTIADYLSILFKEGKITKIRVRDTDYYYPINKD